MNINKADYFTIAQFGNLSMFLTKIDLEKKILNQVKNLCDENGMSVLQHSLVNRKFDISDYLLKNEVELNHISNDGCNELHYLAANINSEGAIKIANKLIDMNVDITLKDKKYKNSPLWYLCQEVLKKPSKEGNQLIIKCLRKKADITSCNVAGFSVKRLIEERGTNEMKEEMEAVPGVTQVFWLNDVLDPSVPPEMLPSDLKNFLYGENDSTLLLVRVEGASASASTILASE